MADSRPELAVAAGPFLLPHLKSSDAERRGLAALTAGAVREKSARNLLKSLTDDRAEFTLYWDMAFKKICVGELAENALDRL